MLEIRCPIIQDGRIMPFAAVDSSHFHSQPSWGEDEQDEIDLLQQLADRARAFVGSHRWAPANFDLRLGFGVGGVIGLFLVRFDREIEGQGRQEIWVVAGDLPSIYFETDDSPTPADALHIYCNIAEDWADRVLGGEDLSECYPVEAEPTLEHAKMLKSRIEYIRDELIPDA